MLVAINDNDGGCGCGGDDREKVFHIKCHFLLFLFMVVN